MASSNIALLVVVGESLCDSISHCICAELVALRTRLGFAYLYGRILKFEPDSSDGKRSDMMVELWDVSGDEKYQSCWPAIAKGVQGAIVVFDVNKEGQENDLDIWFKKFVKGTKIRSGQCLVVANNPSTEPSIRDSVAVGGPLSKAKLVMADIQENPDALRDAFFDLMKGVSEFVRKQREEQEMKLLS
eukprot:m.111147 g.111147  ORF g.111147 m.111147 type:complete len:188 (+) comp13432_c0_seq3:389-952(+)